MKLKSALFVLVLAVVATCAAFVPDAFNTSVLRPFALMTAACLLMVAAFFRSTHAGSISIPLSLYDTVLAALVLVSGLSLLASPFGSAGSEQFVQLILLALFFYAAEHASGDRDTEGFFLALVILASLVSLHGLAGYLTGSARFRLSSILGNPAILSTFMAMSLPFSLKVALDDHRRPVSLLGYLSAFLILASITLSQTRSTMLAVLVILLILFFQTQHRKRLVFFLLASAGLIVAVSTSVLPAGRLTSLATLGRRSVYWDAAWNAFTASPLLGNGFGSFGSFMPRFRSPHYWLSGAEDVSEHAHNFILEQMSETGILGSIVLAILIVLFLRDLQKTIKNNEQAFPLALSITVCLLDNLFNISFSVLPVSLLFWILFGIWAHLSPRPPLATFSIRLPRWSAWLGVPVVMLFLALLFWQGNMVAARMNSERLTYAGLLEYFQRENIPKARVDLTAALRENPSEPFALFHLGLLEYEHGNFRTAVNSLLALQQVQPFFPQSNLYLALSYDSLQYHDSSLVYAKREVALSSHPRGYLVLSALYRRTHRVNDEIRALDSIILLHRPTIDSTEQLLYDYARIRLDSLRGAPSPP